MAGGADSVDGTGSTARFNAPFGLAFDSSTGSLYVADTYNHTIRKITSAGVVTTIAGTAGVAGGVQLSLASIPSPQGITMMGHGMVAFTAIGAVLTLSGL